LIFNIIDVGLGNVRSIEHWLNRSDFLYKRVATEGDFSNGPIVIPGVASAGEYMQKLTSLGLDKAIVARARQGQKVIGICLGFQLLTDHSEEDGGVKCLGVLKGSAKYIDGQKTHNGWEDFYLDSRELETNSCIRKRRKKIVSGRVYFNHELKVELKDSIYCEKLNNKITSFAIKDNIFGFQFHPEKSQITGQELLELIT